MILTCYIKLISIIFGYSNSKKKNFVSFILLLQKSATNFKLTITVIRNGKKNTTGYLNLHFQKKN